MQTQAETENKTVTFALIGSGGCLARSWPVKADADLAAELSRWIDDDSIALAPGDRIAIEEME